MKRNTAFLIIGLLAVVVVYHAIKCKSKFFFLLCVITKITTLSHTEQKFKTIFYLCLKKQTNICLLKSTFNKFIS